VRRFADSGACTPTVCAQGSSQYCGVVGSGCGGKIDCGSCPLDKRAASTASPTCGASSLHAASCVQAAARSTAARRRRLRRQDGLRTCPTDKRAAAPDPAFAVRTSTPALHADQLQPTNGKYAAWSATAARQDGLRRLPGGYTCGGNGIATCAAALDSGSAR